LYAEGQRRYVEVYLLGRQFLGRLDKPKVEYIGIAPAIAIEQVNTTNARSTVGTCVYDYMKLLFFAKLKNIFTNFWTKVKKNTVTDVVTDVKSFEIDDSLHSSYISRRGRKLEDKLSTATAGFQSFA
jgi:excinuclease ABC subunit A